MTRKILSLHGNTTMENRIVSDELKLCPLSGLERQDPALIIIGQSHPTFIRTYFLSDY